MKLTMIAATLVLLGSAAAAPVQSQPAGPAPLTPDFIKAAAQTDAFERQEGRVAAAQSANPAVRSFASMMVRDHTKTTAGLKAAMRRAHIPAPSMTPLSAEQSQMLGQLNGLHGRAFDRTYVDQQVRVHQDALSLMQAYAGGGANGVIRAAAAQTVPIVQHHLRMAKMLQSQL
jgi:putative membrane protein